MVDDRQRNNNGKVQCTRRSFLRKASHGATVMALAALTPGRVIGAQDDKQSAGSFYNEKYRPQFHFTPRVNWTNDPNGLVYYKGEYHMFFQHNPFGINWGNMTWAHAVSTDLIHWKQLANAIEPDELGTIFSGSAVVDWDNTSGFQTGKENVLVAFYTSAGKLVEPRKPFTQSIAYSNDRGMTWVKYDKNPIIEHIRADNRDPKVIRHEPTKTWIMALYLDDHDFILLSSKNLKDWTKIQDIKVEGSGECPDFFELAVDSDPSNTRWVFWGADGSYLLGDFDGRRFNQHSHVLKSRAGNYYAAQTWSDIPKSDGRRIQIAWMAKGKFPGMPFNQQMSIPCELSLRTFPEGIRLCRVPVGEVEKLRQTEYSWGPTALKPGENVLCGISAELFEIRCEIEPGTASEVGFMLRGNELLYNVGDKTVTCKDEKVDASLINGGIKLHVLVDRTSIEIFINDGRMSLFRCFPLDTENKSLEIFARGGNGKIKNMKLYKLKSIWT